jgi:hypothetical protein
MLHNATKRNKKEQAMSSIAVRLPAELVEEAKIHAAKNFRSVPKQIEFWIKVGRAAKDNPDLPVSFIADVLESLEERKTEPPTPFIFG